MIIHYIWWSQLSCILFFVPPRSPLSWTGWLHSFTLGPSCLLRRERGYYDLKQHMFWKRSFQTCGAGRRFLGAFKYLSGHASSIGLHRHYYLLTSYNPNYSENQTWRLYSCEVKSCWEDPDEPRLERAWGRKVEISRMLKRCSTNTVEYGDFNRSGSAKHPFQKIQEYHKRLIKSLALVKIAKESMDSSKASQHLHKIE
jgi:hypothetical protein